MIYPRPDQLFTAPRLAAAIYRRQGGYKAMQRLIQKHGIKSRGVVVVGNREVPGYAYQDLPEEQKIVLEANARREGYEDIAEFIMQDKPEWQPPFDLKQVHPDELAEAGQWREALLPALQRLDCFPAEFAAAMQTACDGAARFTRKPSEKVIRTRLEMVRGRARGPQDFDKVAFYLPERPRLIEAEAHTPGEPLNDLIRLRDEVPRQKPAASRKNRVARQEYDEAVTAVWRCALNHYERMTSNGVESRHARAQLFDVLEKGWLASSREALRKQFELRLANGAEDRRKLNGGEDSELTRQIEALGWFIPAARFFYMHSNRASAFSRVAAGSVPHAVLETISLPELPVAWAASGMRKAFLKKLTECGFPEIPTCPADLRDTITARQKQRNAKLVPDKIAHQIRVPNAVIAMHRSPREASLTLIHAPGSQRRYMDDNGERVIMQPGDWFGGDDSTPGIAVWVECQDVNNPSVQKFGALLGRFQWLVYVDGRTDKILAWDYVVRARGSYRAEDILNGMGTVLRTHGQPRKGWQFEGGTFNSKSVQSAIRLMGAQHWRTYSPHQKPVESVFNRMWTQFAVQFPRADMGRYRNENEENCRLYEECKRGHKNPRQYFPPLDLLLKAIEQAVRRHNEKTIHSPQYGSWQPDEFFAASIAKSPLEPFSQDKAWMLAPFIVERKVRGCLVKCSVPLFEDATIPYEFYSERLFQFAGKSVRLHFDYRQPNCVAKVVLAETHKDFQPGYVIGDAGLIGESAQWMRRALGYSVDDQSAGLKAARAGAHFLRRESQGVGVGGRVEYRKSEHRNGLGDAVIAERGKPLAESKTPATELEGSTSRLAELIERGGEKERRIYISERIYAERQWADSGAGREMLERANKTIASYEAAHPEMKGRPLNTLIF